MRRYWGLVVFYVALLAFLLHVGLSVRKAPPEPRPYIPPLPASSLKYPEI